MEGEGERGLWGGVAESGGEGEDDEEEEGLERYVFRIDARRDGLMAPPDNC